MHAIPISLSLFLLLVWLETMASICLQITQFISALWWKNRGSFLVATLKKKNQHTMPSPERP